MWVNSLTIRDELYRAWQELGGGNDVVLVSGACPQGADSMAEHWWRRQGLVTERHPAVWRPHGIYNPQAGIYRNTQMVLAGADLCLAFIRAGSRGATHCAETAADMGIPVRYYRED